MSYARIDDNDKKMNFDNNSLIQNISAEDNVKKWGESIERSNQCLLCRTYLNLRNLIKFRRQTAEQLPRYNGESDVFVTITTAPNASQSTISYNRFYTTVWSLNHLLFKANLNVFRRKTTWRTELGERSPTFISMKCTILGCVRWICTPLWREIRVQATSWNFNLIELTFFI